MMFTEIANPYGTAAFEKVAYPMTELQHMPAPKSIKRRSRALRAPKPPSQILKNFLLTF